MWRLTFCKARTKGPASNPTSWVLAAKEFLHVFSGQGWDEGEVGFSLELQWVVEWLLWAAAMAPGLSALQEIAKSSWGGRGRQV